LELPQNTIGLVGALRDSDVKAGLGVLLSIASALGSCLNVGYAANAAAMGIELKALRFEMESDLDLRGFLGISEDTRPGYDSVTCTTYIEADASEAELAELRERVESTSPLVDNISNKVSLETELVVT